MASSPGRIYRISGTGFALGTCLAASGEARDYDAVLYCGLQRNPQLSSTWADSSPAGLRPSSHSTPAQSVCEESQGSADASQLPSYLWLPVKGCKIDRQGLQRQLPAALAYLGGHRHMDHTVLICDDDGGDACVCMVVAALVC